MLAAMDGAGIDRTVLVQALTAHGDDNTYLADCLECYPARFTGVMAVDVHAPDLIQRVRDMSARGLVGLRLFAKDQPTDSPVDWLGHEKLFPLWQHAGETGLPVSVQTTGPFDALQTVLSRFKETSVVLDHLGWRAMTDGHPDMSGRTLMALAAFPNLYLKVTTLNFQAASLDTAAAYDALLATVVPRFGAERIVWGSNFPASPGNLGQILRDARERLSFCSAGELEWIFWRTAVSLYPRIELPDSRRWDESSREPGRLETPR